MNSLFPHLRPVLAAAGLVVCAATSSAATVEPIVPPAKRTAVLEQARELLAQKTPPARVANPFFTEPFNEALTGVRNTDASADGTPGDAATRPEPAGPRNSRDLLQSIAQSLKPSGFFVFGGVPHLSFGQKRVKPGGLLTINYEGKDYTLEVVSIDRTNFTLRLNREEFTRPIK